MNFDERIERLTERHEALTQSVELLLLEAKQNAVAARENAIAARENTDNIRKLVEISNRDANDIAALARIAESHERRITGIEGDHP